jgi:hypothetical protein
MEERPPKADSNIPARSAAEKGLTQQLKYNHEQSVDL